MDDTPLHDRIRHDLEQRRAAGLLRGLDETSDAPAVDLATNSYLALHADAGVARAARHLAGGLLSGNLASRLIATASPLYRQLEEEIAAWKAVPAALVFASGYAANLGILQALCTRDTEVFSDRLNHASIVDGIVLARARMTRYRHGDMNDLETRLRRSPRRERLIVTDTVFSMDGDRAPLADICELARRYSCWVMADEAHAAGIFGTRQSGLVEETGVEPLVDIRMGTLSKAVAGLGGFFAGNALVKEFLVNHARGFIYSTGLPHAVLAHDLAAVRHIRSTPGLGADVRRKAARLRERLRAAGFDTMASSTQVVPCLIGDARHAAEASAYLAAAGIRAPAIRPPTVPNGTARLRFSVHRGLSDAQIDFVAETLARWPASRPLNRGRG